VLVQVVVDALAFEWILAEQVLGDHADLSVGCGVAANVFAGDAQIGPDRQHVAGLLQTITALKDLVEAVVVNSEIKRLVDETVDGDLGDARRTRHALSVRGTGACRRLRSRLPTVLRILHGDLPPGGRECEA